MHSFLSRCSPTVLQTFLPNTIGVFSNIVKLARVHLGGVVVFLSLNGRFFVCRISEVRTWKKAFFLGTRSFSSSFTCSKFTWVSFLQIIYVRPVMQGQFVRCPAPLSLLSKLLLSLGALFGSHVLLVGCGFPRAARRNFLAFLQVIDGLLTIVSAHLDSCFTISGSLDQFNNTLVFPLIMPSTDACIRMLSKSRFNLRTLRKFLELFMG